MGKVLGPNTCFHCGFEISELFFISRHMPRIKKNNGFLTSMEPSEPTDKRREPSRVSLPRARVNAQTMTAMRFLQVSAPP